MMPGSQPMVDDCPQGPQMIADYSLDAFCRAVKSERVSVPDYRCGCTQYIREGDRLATLQRGISCGFYFISGYFNNTVEDEPTVGLKEDDLAFVHPPPDGMWKNFNYFAIAYGRMHTGSTSPESGRQSVGQQFEDCFRGKVIHGR